jgi:hypothetical protein
MQRFHRELVEAGVLRAAEGLHASSRGMRVFTEDGGKRSLVTDGPFAETKELIAGYCLLELKSRAEAIEWAKRVPCSPGIDGGVIELRELYEPSDFVVDGVGELPVGPTSAATDDPGSQRYALLLKADACTEAGLVPTRALIVEMGGLMKEIAAEGALLAGEGLKPSAHGARVERARDKIRVIDGPFAEAKELVAGFSVCRASSKAQVVDWARRMLEIHVRGTGMGAGQVEIREIFEACGTHAAS